MCEILQVWTHNKCVRCACSLKVPNDTNFFWATFFILYEPLEFSTGACLTPSGLEIGKTHHFALLESFRKPPKAFVMNSSHPQRTSKEKEIQICHQFVQVIDLLTWHSLCFNHLVLSNFWQCRSAIP